MRKSRLSVEAMKITMKETIMTDAESEADHIQRRIPECDADRMAKLERERIRKQQERKAESKKID